MTDPTKTTEDPSAAEEISEDRAHHRSERVAGATPLVEADLLVEEVSIDGMCGVY